LILCPYKLEIRHVQADEAASLLTELLEYDWFLLTDPITFKTFGHCDWIEFGPIKAKFTKLEIGFFFLIG